jgi:hypothetical protein
MNHPKRLYAGVAVLALAVTAGVFAVRSDHGGARGGSAAAAGVATPGVLTDAQKKARKAQIDLVLAERATAVLKGDLRGFLAAVDPKQPALVARQRLLFTNLRKFGFTKLTYFAADERQVPELTKYGPGAFTTRVMMRYELAGLDAKPVQTDLGYTFVRRGDAWILVEDSAIDAELSRDGHRQAWDFEEVAVVRRGKVVVVVDQRELALGQKIAQVSQGAVDAVRRHWPRPWNGAVMVVAMAEPRVMAVLWSSGSGSGWTIAAKAVTLYDGEPVGPRRTTPVSSRIVVNPAVRKQLDKDLLAHEMTHVATTPIGNYVPIWLVEGLAEYVRCASIEDDPQWTVDPYRKQVRTKYLPAMKVLPTQAEFDADGDRAYGQSWWITSYLQSKLGGKGLASLYTDLAQHNTTATAYSTILKKHTGKTPAALVAAAKEFKG